MEGHLQDMADLRGSEAPLGLLAWPMPLLRCASLKVCVMSTYKY